MIAAVVVTRARESKQDNWLSSEPILFILDWTSESMQVACHGIIMTAEKINIGRGD